LQYPSQYFLMKSLALPACGVGLLAVLSLFVGVSDVALGSLLDGSVSDDALQVLLVSRVPRTLALVLAGAAMAVSGLILQMLARNKFVEPSTAGTAESAILGILAVTLLAPGMPVMGRMLVASVFGVTP
jgi:iron complex transport system permease protein